MLGLNGGANGTGFSGPSQTQIDSPTTVAQANTAYNQTQQGLQNQQNFVNATQAQNGLGNQSSVFNQLQGVANGTGPNPAQAQLAQATGANTANQAALMAGQRGSNANAGLIARQAAMQGGANQQNSAGQAASLQAQQSLNALSGLGNLATQQVGQQQQALSGYNQAAQGQQQNLLNGIAAQNNARVGIQSNINSVNGQLANTSMQGQQGLMGGLMNSAGGIASAVGSLFAEGGKVPRQMLAGGMQQVSQLPPQAGQYAPIDPNAPDVFDPSKTNSGAPIQVQAPAAAVPAAQQAQAKANTIAAPRASNNAKSSAPSQPVAQAEPNYGNPGANALYKGASSFGSFLSSLGSSNSSDPAPEVQAASDQLGVADPNNIMQGDAGFNREDQMAASQDPGTMNAAEGGKVPAMVSPGERYLPPKEVQEVKAGKKNPMEAGEKIPGEAKVKGAKDSYANDTVPKDLEAGGLVLPRSVTQSKHPHWAAMKFVQAHMAQGGKVLPKKPKAKK